MDKLSNLEAKYFPGVGETRAKTLASELDIHSARDLLYYFPFRYVDRSKFYRIAEFAGEMPSVQLLGRFVSFEVQGEGARERLVGLFSDGRGLIEVLWFARVKQLKNAYKIGEQYVLFGKPQQYRNNSSWSMIHPEVEVFNPERPPEGLRGIYSITDGLRKKFISTRTFQNIFMKAFESPRLAQIHETLPPEIVSKLGMMPLRETLHNMHLPSAPEPLAKARERMKFEELFYIQMQILKYSKERGQKIRGPVFSKIGDYFNSFYSNYIPFELTGAQKRVLKEIRADMRTGRQMNRLLQGDVGSGKTMVAFMTMLMALDNGYQASIMAPTEILASQHYETISEWGRKIGVNVRLLTGSTKAAERREIHAGILDGSIQILIGTHALLEDTVKFKQLGVAIIDEQHRFGVAQRAGMWRKAEIPPHVLVMTATPIPRTLAMTVYGDLDVSVIDELPPGRKPITTILRYDETRASVDRLIMQQLHEGRQVYIVYPLITENEKLELKSVEAGFEYTKNLFKGYEVVMVHGRMKPDIKEAAMQRFVSGEARIMVATTVIEVGVNVPNASVMMIQNAERFGLSQLHQLRGRVGRGADESFCILMTKQQIGADTRKRLNIMTQTTDGFLISEADLKLRGPGDMEGTQQSGLAFNLKVADLARDGQILMRAREAANDLLDGKIQISPESAEILRREMQIRFARSVDWSLIS